VTKAGVPHGGPARVPNCRTVEFSEKFLELSWAWFQDKDLLRLMSADPFNRVDQRRWFDSLQERSDYRIWGVEFNGVAVGAFGLKGITSPEAGPVEAEWFMYVGSSEFRGLGIGDWIEREVVVRAKQLGITKIWGTARSDNLPVLRLHQRHGFTFRNAEKDGYVYVEKSI
jgi:RimJ/RimL family protein N-acetyltransferase